MALAMNTPAVLRAFRSGEYRHLARLAMAQGWDVYVKGGGHVAAVNPRNGAQVLMSETAYASGGALAAKRQEFLRGGLDLRSKSERRRAHRQEGRMAIAAPIPTEVRSRKPGGAGGNYAILSRETIDMGGTEGWVNRRANGSWTATWKDPTATSGYRNRQDQSREAILAKVTEALGEGLGLAQPERIAETPELQPSAMTREVLDRLDPDPAAV